MEPIDYPCTELFERLASEAPNGLIEMLGRLHGPELAEAISVAAAQLESSPALVRALARVVDAEEAYVREAAVSALALHLHDPEALAAMSRVAAAGRDEAARKSANRAITLWKDFQ